MFVMSSGCFGVQAVVNVCVVDVLVFRLWCVCDAQWVFWCSGCGVPISHQSGGLHLWIHSG